MKNRNKIYPLTIYIFFILMLSAGISTGESKKMQGSESDNKPGAEKVIKKEEVKSSPNEVTTPGKEINNPDKIVIKYNPLLIVTFPHKKHNIDEKISCNICHHNNGGEVKCTACHSVAEVKDKKLPLLAGRPPEGAFHTRCIGCHEKEEKGPSEAECNACHSKD